MRKKIISLFASVLIFLIILFSSIQTSVKYGLAILVLCISLWITESIPRGITGLLPAVLVPLFGIMPFEDITVNYMNRVVLLLLSGFIIASAISKWKLDKKIFYSMLNLTKDSRYVLLVIILTTGLISTIIANTTAAALMLPVGFSMVNSSPVKIRKKFSICVLLAIAYAATIGGMATLIGTPPNLLVAQFLSRQNVNLTFSDWLKFLSPFSFMLLIVLWVVLLFRYNLFKREEIKVKIEKIPLEIGAKITIVIIVSAIIVWSVKSFIPVLKSIDDVVVGLVASVLLIIIPIPGRKVLLGWKDLKIPWDILLMFGGGIALGNMLFVSGTAQYVVNMLPTLPTNFTLIVLTIGIMSIVLTESMSTTTFTSTFIPIFLVFTKGLEINPLFVALTVGICGSMSFALPISTPPNTIVYKTKHFRASEMIKTGILLKIVSLILWVLYVYVLNRVYF